MITYDKYTAPEMVLTEIVWEHYQINREYDYTKERMLNIVVYGTMYDVNRFYNDKFGNMSNEYLQSEATKIAKRLLNW